MDRKAARAILEQFDAAQIHLKAGLDVHNLPYPLRNEIKRISQMQSFETDLEDFLAAHKLPELTKHRSDGWTHFLHLYGQVVEDCPLVVKGSGLANIAKVTLHLEMARETVKHDHGEEMLFKVTWTIEDKNGASGDLFILNSFSVL